jgi:hypothetical protein
MPGDYQYDIFLSYRRKWPSQEWVQNHFYQRLEGLLGESLPHSPRVFLDTREIETGQEWPLVLQEALKGSRCLVSVWSPEYFRSAWCVAELHSMLERERLLGYRTGGHAGRRLVYPIVFADGLHFPDYTKAMQYRDLQKWNIPDTAFARSRKILGFHEEMKKVAEELADLILQAPAWQDDWPIVTPAVLPVTTVHVPRLP